MGKSISHSLEDDDSELIQTTTTTRGFAPYASNVLPVRHQTQEEPPSSIFKTNPLILISGYLRHIDILNDKICSLCCDYYTLKYKSLVLDSNYAFHMIDSIDDESYDNIEMGHDTSILSKSPVMKLSSSRNLKMDWNASISMDRNGTIILTVFGDVNMGKNTLCKSGGNIYIECNNLIMRTGSVITTINNKQIKGNLKEFGNIYMRIKQSLIMDSMATIKSGNIKIECKQLKIGMKSEIKALRNNLWIIAQNGIVSDHNLNNALYAKIEKRIDNKNQLNNDITAIKETMRDNVSYKLTMFNIDQEFECCICWENTPNIMIEPCHHSTFCESCVVELNPIECPICRTTIIDTKKL